MQRLEAASTAERSRLVAALEEKAVPLDELLKTIGDTDVSDWATDGAANVQLTPRCVRLLQRLRGVELERALSESRNQQRCAEAHKPSSSDKTLDSAAASERLDEESNGVGEVATETVERLTRLNRFLRQQNRELEGRWASDKNGGCNDLLTLDDNDSRAVDEAREVLGYTYPSLHPSAVSEKSSAAIR